MEPYEQNGGWLYAAAAVRISLNGPLCRWDYQDAHIGSAEFFVYIDAGTSSPTAIPSAAPTAWYQHPGHQLNVSELQRIVSELQQTVAAQAETIATLVGRVAFDALDSRLTGSLELVREEIAVVRDTVLANVSAVSVTLATLTTALRSAAAADARSGPANPLATGAPKLTTDGAVVSVIAPERFSLHTERCIVDDVCTAAAFAARLAAALLPP